MKGAGSNRLLGLDRQQQQQNGLSSYRPKNTTTKRESSGLFFIFLMTFRPERTTTENTSRAKQTNVPREMLVDDVAGRADHLFQATAAPHLCQDVQGPLETLAVFPRNGFADLPWSAHLLGWNGTRALVTTKYCCRVGTPFKRSEGAGYSVSCSLQIMHNRQYGTYLPPYMYKPINHRSLIL